MALANPEAAQTRKLPQVERNAKMITLRAALPGVNIEKQLEPSHSLLDLVSQLFESQQLAYISPDRCTSREWEVAMGKTSKQIQLDSDHLVVKGKSDTPDQVASTEMQIYEALQYPIQLARDVAQRFLQAHEEAGMKLPPSQLQDMTSSSASSPSTDRYTTKAFQVTTIRP